MIINFGFNPSSLLLIAGYKNHKDGFIRIINSWGDRWHIKCLEGGRIDIHFDKVKIKYQDSNYHIAEIYKPGIQKEIKRIKGFL